MYKRLAMADLVTQRFFCWSRGLEVVLFSSQIGFRLCSDKIGLLYKSETEYSLQPSGEYSLQPSGDLSVTDQQWGGVQAASSF